MEEQWLADRTTLRTLLRTQPQWRLDDYAAATGRSRAWVKKWVTRFRGVPSDDDSVLHSQSRARHRPPAALSPLVIDQILAIRDHPPQNLHRTPGPKAILYYLHDDVLLHQHAVHIPRSTRTVWRILTRYSRIPARPAHTHLPIERPAPMTVWQLDFKDASTVPAEFEGKQQHVVEVLNTVDAGTSLLVDTQARDDLTAETTLLTMAQTLRDYGLPDTIMVDRDPRFVGSGRQRACPAAFIRFWLCLGVTVTICPPRRPDINCFVERYHRAYDEECLRVHRPADLAAVQAVTQTYQQHYNAERPHQGTACGNRPPRVAFPTLPQRPALPAYVDPDRWVDELDGQRYVRKVGRDTRVTIDNQGYYIGQEFVGQEVVLRIDAARRMFVVEHRHREVKRIPLRGLLRDMLPFEGFLRHMCEEARTEYQRQRQATRKRRRRSS